MHSDSDSDLRDTHGLDDFGDVFDVDGEEVRDNPTPGRKANGQFRKGKRGKKRARKGTAKRPRKNPKRARKNPKRARKNPAKGGRSVEARLSRLEKVSRVLVHNVSAARTHLTDVVNSMRSTAGMRPVKTLSGFVSMSGYGSKLARKSR
jgi:hypothetical protein